MFGIEAAIPIGASNSSWSRLTMLSEQGSGGHTNNCASHQVGSTGTVVGLSNVSKGEWNHVAVVYNSTIQGQENLEFYINGVLDVAYQCDFTFTPNLEKRSIGSEDGGQSHLYSSTDMGFFDGKIDELAVWQRTLAPQRFLLLLRMNQILANLLNLKRMNLNRTPTQLRTQPMKTL